MARSANRLPEPLASRSARKVKVAIARKLAIVFRCIRVDGPSFDWRQPTGDRTSPAILWPGSHHRPVARVHSSRLRREDVIIAESIIGLSTEARQLLEI